MTFEIGLVFVLLAVSILLFITNWIRSDIIAILVLLGVVLSGILPVEEALSGFSSEAVLAIAGLLVLSQGLVRSGVMRWIARQLNRLAGKGEKQLVVMSTTLPGVLSGLVSDIATVSLFIPVVTRLARRNKIPRSRLLLPIAMAALAGGNLTIIGASHNLVVNSLLLEAGEPGFGFFELAPVGAVLLIGFSLYSLFLGRHFLPGQEREKDGERKDGTQDLIQAYDLWDRLWEISVYKDSTFIGKSTEEIHAVRKYGLSIVAIVRDDETRLPEDGPIAVEEGDVLLVTGQKERTEQLVAQEPGLELLGHPESDEEFPASGAELVEVVVPPHSPEAGKSLKDMNLREISGLTGIAIWRNNRPIRTDVSTIPLEEGDGVLIYGPNQDVREFDPEPNFLWLQKPRKEEAPEELRHLGPWAALILAVVIITAALDLIPIAVAALAGAAAMVLLGILSPKEAYGSVEWRTVVLIGGMYSLGLAMESSGAAELISTLLVDMVGSLGIMAVMLGILIISMLLTQMLHGAAVAVVMTPVALYSAGLMDVSIKPLAMAVIVGAAATYLLPVGHPAPLLVQKPGSYREKDYLKFGSGLFLLTIIIAGIVLPLVWPF
jgi:di/tricarboxylate transporter